METVFTTPFMPFVCFWSNRQVGGNVYLSPRRGPGRSQPNTNNFPLHHANSCQPDGDSFQHDDSCQPDAHSCQPDDYFCKVCLNRSSPQYDIHLRIMRSE